MDTTQTQAAQDTGDIEVTDMDIVQEVIREGPVTEEQIPDEVVDFSAPEQGVVNEEIPIMDWELEAKKFQSMYDKSQADNSKLQRLEPLGDLLESRPDLVQTLQDGMSNPQQPVQPNSQNALSEQDFNPWDAYYNPESPSYRFRINNETRNVKGMIDSALGEQKRQMTEEITYNNTVNELRNTYKFTDGDVQQFMQFVTQPKEQVGLSNLVKLYRDVNQMGNVSDTARAVQSAKEQPRTAGVLQGGSTSSPKTEENKVWDRVVAAGSRNNVL